MERMQDEDLPHGDAEGSGPAPWTEADWTAFLRRQDLEVARFLAAYNEVKSTPDRLDTTARRMGWEPGEWSPGAETPETDPDPGVPADLPYCIHQHPVFIAARALCIQSSTAFRTLLRDSGKAVPPLAAAEGMLALWDAHHNTVMAVNATDTGDLTLAIAQMKRALGAINTAIGLLQELPAEARLGSNAAFLDAQGSLFDLRDVCLRVISDCRWGTEEQG
jgi:hypothetical protein